MPRYVDADKIISHLNDEIELCGYPDLDRNPIAYGTYIGLLSAKSFVATAERADVVEIVRCKDCEHRGTGQCITLCSGDPYIDFDTEDNDFCCYGKRRKEDA